MNKIRSYLSKEGWKKDWNQTKADARALRRSLNYKLTDKVGKAYGFLQYNVQKQVLQREIRDSQIATKAPSGLEIKLDTIDEFEPIEGLKDICAEQKADGKNYVLTASYKGATNAEAEQNLGTTFNDLYQSDLRKEGDTFRVSMFYD